MIMEKIILFLKFVSLPFGVMFTLAVFSKCWFAWDYVVSKQYARDKAEGVSRSFPILWPLLGALVCWGIVFIF
jgi:hypothetical protein